jgi:hypothetical protein
MKSRFGPMNKRKQSERRTEPAHKKAEGTTRRYDHTRIGYRLIETRSDRAKRRRKASGHLTLHVALDPEGEAVQAPPPDGEPPRAPRRARGHRGRLAAGHGLPVRPRPIILAVAPRPPPPGCCRTGPGQQRRRLVVLRSPPPPPVLRRRRRPRPAGQQQAQQERAARRGARRRSSSDDGGHRGGGGGGGGAPPRTGGGWRKEAGSSRGRRRARGKERQANANANEAGEGGRHRQAGEEGPALCRVTLGWCRCAGPRAATARARPRLGPPAAPGLARGWPPGGAAARRTHCPVLLA